MRRKAHWSREKGTEYCLAIIYYAVLSVSFEVAGWVKDVGGWVNEHRRCEPLGGSGGMPPQKILKSRRSEMAFPAFSNTYFPLKWQCKKCNTGAKSVTPVQITHRNSGLIDWKTKGNFLRQWYHVKWWRKSLCRSFECEKMASRMIFGLFLSCELFSVCCRLRLQIYELFKELTS